MSDWPRWVRFTTFEFTIALFGYTVGWRCGLSDYDRAWSLRWGIEGPGIFRCGTSIHVESWRVREQRAAVDRMARWPKLDEPAKVERHTAKPDLNTYRLTPESVAKIIEEAKYQGPPS